MKILRGGGKNLFTIRDNLKRYIETIDERGKVVESESPVGPECIENDDGSISITQGDRFWSARKSTGTFDLRPKNLEWEHFIVRSSDPFENLSPKDEATVRAFDEYETRRAADGKKLQLALCCGTTHYGADWFCTDLIATPQKNIWSLDITKPFLIRSEKISFAYIEHGTEHIPFDGLVTCFKECFRVLDKGGVLRFTTPSLANWIKYYVSNEPRNDRITKLATNRWIKSAESLGIYSKALVFNNAMRNWGHQCVLDFETYEQLLRHVGFSKITDTAIGKSVHPELMNMEHHAISGALKEYNASEILIVEATK